MKDSDKTKGQLVKELAELRRRIAELEAAESERELAEESPALEVEQLTALIQASHAVTASLELDQVLAEIVSLAGEAVGSDYTSVVLVDEAGRMGRSAENLPGVPSIKFRIRDEGLTSWIVDSAQAVIIDEIGEDGAMIADLGAGAVCFVNPSVVEAGVRSVAGLPLRGKERLLGVIYLHSLRLSAFHGQLPLLTAFANQASIAIENARLYEAEQAARERADTLRQVSRAVGSTLELDEVLSLVLRQAKRVLTYDTASILLFAGGESTMAAVSGYEDEELVKSEATLRLSDSPILQAMARDHRPVVIADVREDERWIWVPGTEEIRAWVGVPLLVRDEMIGTLMVDSTQPGSYTAADATIAQALANQAAGAIENARLYEQTQHHLESLTNLNRASQTVASSLDVSEVLEQIVELAEPVVNSDYTSVVLLDEEGEPVLAFGNLHRAPHVTGGIRSSGVTRHVLDSGQPVIVDTISDEGVMSPPLRQPDGELIKANPTVVAAGVCSFAAVPIQAKGMTLGVLFVHSRQPRAFHGQVPLLTTFANQTAGAIENARLYQAEQRRSAELQALYDTSLRLGTQLEMFEELLRLIVEQAVALLGAEAGGFYLYDPQRDELTFSVATGYFTEFVGATLEPGEGLAGKVFASRRPLAVENYRTWPERAAIYEGESRFRATLGVPLLGAEGVLGVLDVGGGEHKRAFDKHDVWLAELFAAQAAIAIENARLYEQAQQEIAERKRAEEAVQQHNRELDMLNRASHALVSTLDLDQLLATVLEEVRRLMDVIACSVWLTDRGTDELVCLQAIGPRSEMVCGWRLALGQGICGWVVRHGESLIVPDVWADERYFKGVDEQTGLGLRSSLTLPLRVKEDVIGALQVLATEVGRFSTADLDLVEPLAASAAIAIENARLYEQARLDAETKSMLLREVNHRVKNNLTAIVGLLRAEQSHARVEDQPIYQPIMQNLINRVQGLATVHSLLSASEWSPLSLSELTAQGIRSTMQTLPRDKRLSVDVTPSLVRVTPDQAHSLALVINELTTNTIKHGLQERETARIGVCIELDEDTVQFEFRDDGPGYPEEVLQLEHSGVGFDLIQNLVRKNLDGELLLHNDRGAVAVIRFAAQA